MFEFVHPQSWLAAAPAYAAALLFGYLLGSIPFGLIFARIAGAGDVRQIGSGNIGATNVLRTGNRWAAGATFVFDAAKGATAVLLTQQFFGDELAVFAALGAILGHLFPVWLGFKGGKGVSTYFGIMTSLAWPVGLLAAASWLAIAVVFKISSLSALVTVVLGIVFMILFHHPLYATLAAALAAIIWYMHRANIARLLSGTEPRIGQKSA
ncbi:MAG: glycerol-3-phosphate 1-O-acyltransferase PlsY [Alphaproteobacteria bacterium]|nr:glycerol-3-phosphate 1-O-acyltransferase PlsY [Alphaproteobacteria bacterium]